MKEFDQDLAVEAARVETINKLAEKLTSQGHAGSADITHRQQALSERWDHLQDRASERRQRLAEACEMHAFDRDCNDVSDMINEKVSHEHEPSLMALLPRVSCSSVVEHPKY